MYDSNNYTYSNGGFVPTEPSQKPPKKSGGNAGKIIAGVLAVVILGGASGYGGAYLANMNSTSSVLSENVSGKSDDSSESETHSQTEAAAAENSSADDTFPTAETVANQSTAEGETSAKAAIAKATPSVAFITSEFTKANETGSGTGIVFTEDGYIVTNAHVITAEMQLTTSSPSYDNDPFSNFFDNFYNFNYGTYETEVVTADKITVTLNDDSEYEAKLIGYDANSDLAVLKIEADGLAAAEIADSSNLAMGDKAITLGYPLGLGLSASDGIISGLDKEITIEVAGKAVTMTLIQTDAAVNPGNSGGPLLNEYGQVIGITSSKIVSSSVDGVGFAIPITEALPIINELMTTGTVKSTVPKIGITGTPITSAVQRYYNLPVDSGVLVVAVEAGSCAETAGNDEVDIIIAADAEEVTDMDTLISLKNKHKAGEKMTLTLARNDQNVDVELVLDAE